MDIQGLESEGQGCIEYAELLRELIELNSKNGIVRVNLVSKDEELLLTEEDAL